MTTPRERRFAMDELVSPANTRLDVVAEDKTPEARALEHLVTILVTVLIVAALAYGRQIFVPLAVAVLLSFVLAPLVKILRGINVSRGIAITIVVLFAGTFVAGFGVILGRQVSDLAMDLPAYQQTIARKIDNLRGAAAESTIIDRASRALDALSQQLSRSRPKKPSAQAEEPDNSPQTVEPIPVEVHQPNDPFEMMKTVIQTILEPLATTGIIVVFVVFILMQREDVRDRLIRLAGAHDLHRTTLAIDDAARRLSRYFLVQTLLNVAFGTIVAIGLFLIGVPSALLWGGMAAVLRFVPYIGAVVSAAFPVALAAAVDPGWSMVWMTGAMFLVTETIIGQVIEPLLYGHSTGLSPLAVIVSATFWTWLWGPVGLVLATPLTVCLVVLGRHVERLEFLEVLLGDKPPLTPTESFYQRLLAADAEEAFEHAETYLEKHAISAFYEDVAMPALALARADVRRGILDVQRQRRIRDTMRALIEDLSDYSDVSPLAAEKDDGYKPQPGESTRIERRATIAPILDVEQVSPDWRKDSAILAIAGRGPIDEAGANLFVSLLKKHGLHARAISADAFSTDLEDNDVRLACFCMVGADNSRAQVRFGLRRLKRRLPSADLLACFWTTEQSDTFEELCSIAEGSPCASSLSDALNICIEAARRGPSEGRQQLSGVA